MPYSAGTVFLEVVPSFHNVQRTMATASKGAGKPLVREMDNALASVGKNTEKAGDDHAKKYSGAFSKKFRSQMVKAASALEVKITADSTPAERSMAVLAAKIKAFSDLEIRTDLNAAKALEKAAVLNKELDAVLRDQEVDVDFRYNANEARAAIQSVADAVRAATGATAAQYAEAKRKNAQYNKDRLAAARELALAEREISRAKRAEEIAQYNDARAQYTTFNKERVANAKAAALAERAADRERLAQEKASARESIRITRERNAAHLSAIRARADTERSAAKEASTLLRNAYRENAEFDRRRAYARRSSGTAVLETISGQAANAVRLFNGRMLAAIALGPLLIPVLAGIAAGLGTIAVGATLAVAGVGALVAGLAGIGGAVKALAGVDKENRKQTGGSGASDPAKDTRGLRDAQIALGRAREDAGRQIVSAVARQETAEKTLTKAIKDAATAQRDLISARIDAAQSLEDINNKMASGLLEEQLATYALQEARFSLNNVLEDPQASQREREIAQLTYDQQVQSFKELQISNRRLAVEVADTNKKGVEGSDQVVSAQENIVSANEQVSSAQKDVADASAELTQARVEEARTIADAERNVADAMYDLQLKTSAAGIAGSSAMDALAESMRGLSPAGQEFARFLYGLSPLLEQIRFAAQGGMLPGFQEMISSLVNTYGPGFVAFIGEISQVIGDLAVKAGKALTAPFWRDFFSMMAQYAPIFLQQFGSISGSLLTMIAGVLEAFAPFSAELGAAFVEIAQAMADWGKNLAGTEAFTAFLEFVRLSGPDVFKLLGLVSHVLINLMIGLAPYADMLMRLLIAILEWVVGLDPATLGKFATTFIVLGIVVQTIAGLLAPVAGIATLLVGFLQTISLIGAGGGLSAIFGAAGLGGAAALLPWILGIAAVIGVIFGLIAVFKNLYETNDAFKTHIDRTWSIIVGVFSFAWGVISGIFNAWVTYLNLFVFPVMLFLYNNIVKPVFENIAAAISIAWQVIKTVFNMLYQIITFVIMPVFQALYDKVIRPVWEDKIQPIFTALGNFVRDNVAPAFQTGIDAISRIWETLRDIAKAPVRFVVDTVINKGIIDNFNKLVDIFPGMTKVDRISLPQGFASGGVLPGYTPGRDVHRFVSPTGGMLDLSGGEGIMVPELTRQIGARRLQQANRAARSGRGGAEFLGGFKNGGILGWLGGAAGSATDAISGAIGAAGDLLRDPSSVLRKIVENLLGDGNTGFAALVAGVPRKLVGGIIDSIKGLLSGGDNAAPTGGGSPLGWQSMEAVIRSAFPQTQFTSAFRPNAITAVGTKSYHGLGRAVDMAPSMDLFNWISRSFPDSRELFYSPAGAAQILNGNRNPNLAPITRQMHYNHVHWAYKDGGVVPNLYDNGGWIPPGVSMIANKTGKPEAVFTGDQFDKITNNNSGGGDIIFQGDINGGEEISRKIAEMIEMKRRDANTMNQIAAIGVSL